MHSIRLHGPWEFEVLGADLKGKIAMPAERLPLDGAVAGRVRLTRPFGRPTGLATGDLVWLVIEQAAPPGSLGQAEEGTGGRFDVTADLAERNRLAIEVDLPLENPPLGEVRLEIEPARPDSLSTGGSID